MTTQELRELDAWIDRNLFENDLPEFSPHYTTDQHHAMDVLKKCAEKCLTDISIGTAGPNEWRVWAGELNGATYAPTLEVCICLFAKQLFSQTTK